MKNSFLPIFLTISILAGIQSVKAEKGTLLLRTPSISEDHLVFVYAGDIWIAQRDGSYPVRLTVHQGVESFPYLSPDGQWVAFTGFYDGNQDVFVVPVEGGEPKRLTYHPSPDVVCGWTPDSKSVLFRSDRENFTHRFNRLYTIPAAGGFPESLEMPIAQLGSLSPDESRAAYVPLREPFHTWKHYRGGTVSRIWIFDRTTYDVTEIPREDSNDTRPVWMDENSIYFISDRNWTMNIFKYDLPSGDVRQVTFHDDYDVKSLQGYQGTLVYEQGGQIHTLNTLSGKSDVVPIHISPDLPFTRPHYIDGKDYIHDYQVSPTGVRALFMARGDIFTVPKEDGSTRDLTHSSGAHDRYPRWSPDGSKIAWMSDMDGEYKLYVVDQKGKEKPEKYSLGKTGFFYLMDWSPDNSKLLYYNELEELFTYDVENGKKKKIDQNLFDVRVHDAAWSPDSRFIAYTKKLPNGFHALYVYDLEKKKPHQLTDGMSHASSPAWSRDGKFLFFTASTNIALNNSFLDMSSYERPSTENIYLIVLDSETENPFLPKSDEEESESEESGDEESKEDSGEEKDELTVTIDYDRLDQRILALPVGNGNFFDLQTAEENKLFFSEFNEASGKTILHRYDLSEKEDDTYLEGINGYRISADGKNILYAANGKKYGIVKAGNSPKVGDGLLNLDGMRMKVDPREEWKQIYEETWRLQRDFFYDPNMHGADWKLVREKYRPFLKYVGHRSDLTYLQGEMIGELVVGHAYVWDGDKPEVTSVTVGLLGADYELVDGYYRFKHIYDGLNWNPDLRAPLTTPGVDVQPGDYLLAVNGEPLKYPTNLYSLFQDISGTQVTITVNSSPAMDDAREVVVEPISSERSLRYRDWVEGNREYVERATDGRVAYVYMPNTAWAGYTSFNRYYFSQVDKNAVIIDERWNGGGSAADYIIDMLNRSLLNWWITRTGLPWATPFAAIYGPKVMIINEAAGSGGDAMPLYFRRRGLGELVGKRTWGGLVGMSGNPSLIDGGGVTVPQFAILSPDNHWEVENEGVSPDYDVEYLPKSVLNGHDPQLDKAIEVILKDLESWPTPKLDVPKRPVRAKKK